MFNRIGKAVEASRDAIGTLQTTLKEQGIDPVSFSARLRASSTASLPPVAGNRQQLDMGIDEDGDNDGFSQQSLMGSSAADTRNGIANEGSVAATSGNSEPSAGGADLMRFSEESNGAGLADASPRQSLERKGPNEAPEDSRGGDSLQMPATAASNENSSSVLSPSVPSSLSQPLLPITASAAASPAPSISPIPPPRPAPVQQTASDDSSTFAPQSQPALSSMNAEDVLRMDVSEMTERLARLRRFEAKFSDVAKHCKRLQERLQQINSIVGTHTPIARVATAADLEALDLYLSSLRDKQEMSSAEISRLTRRVSEISEIQALEASTKADMFGAMQSKLLEREEEINRLKTALNKKQQREADSASAERPPGLSPSAASMPELSEPAASAAPGTALSLRLKLDSAKIERLTQENANLTQQLHELTARKAKLRPTETPVADSEKESRNAQITVSNAAEIPIPDSEDELENTQNTEVDNAPPAADQEKEAETLPSAELDKPEASTIDAEKEPENTQIPEISTAETPNVNLEKIKELEDRIAEIENRCLDLEEQLALAKHTIHERDDAVQASDAEVANVKKLLKEEEEKKIKSIQLLRQSKAKILKLEADVKIREETITQLQEEVRSATETHQSQIKEKETQLGNVTRQIEDMQTRLRRQQNDANELERERQEFAAERLGIQSRIDLLAAAESKLRGELDAVREELEMRQAELESARSTLEARDTQLNSEMARWSVTEERLANMEHELETSKRLFQSKSAENDQLRLRTSELEAQLYEAGQVSGRFETDTEALRREIREARRDANQRGQELTKLQEEADSVKAELAQAQSTMQAAIERRDEGMQELDELLKRIEDWERKEDEWKSDVATREQKLGELQNELAALRHENLQAQLNRDKALEDMRVQERQMKNLNKTLKDEVRKLSRTASMSNTPTSAFPGSASSASFAQLPGMQSPPVLSRLPSTGSIHSGRNSQQGSSSSLASTDDRSFSGVPPPHPSSSGGLIFPPRRPSSQNNPYAHSSSAARLSVESNDTGRSHSQLGIRTSPTASNTGSALPDPDPEYLKAVFLKFLEARDKRGQLIQVLGMLLRFTPEELRRVQKTV